MNKEDNARHTLRRQQPTPEKRNHQNKAETSWKPHAFDPGRSEEEMRKDNVSQHADDRLLCWRKQNTAHHMNLSFLPSFIVKMFYLLK